MKPEFIGMVSWWMFLLQAVNASVNTASVNDLHIGSGFDGSNPMAGSLDEFRITNQVRAVRLGLPMNIKTKSQVEIYLHMIYIIRLPQSFQMILILPSFKVLTSSFR